MEKIRVRFAPSPTGPLHIGGARSALFNYLFAKQNQGDFILRMEDTDLERSSRESEENIKSSLKWLGIDWNEGIDVGGPHEPYRQTERLELYQKAAERLIRDGYAYYCYCTEEECEAERQELIARGETPRYLGRCRDLTQEERRLFEAEGRRPVIRFRVPDNYTITIEDMVRGEVSFDTEGMGDYIIVKSGKSFHTTNLNGVTACPPYLGAHTVKEISQVNNFRLPGGISNHSRPGRKYCRHHDILRRPHTGKIKINFPPCKRQGTGLNIAISFVNFRT